MRTNLCLELFMREMVAVEARDIDVRLGGPGAFRLQIPELELNRGQLCAVVGANGAGKTTLLSVLAGERIPDTGRVRYTLRDSTSSPAAILDWHTSRTATERLMERVAFVPPSPPRWPLRLLEQLELDAALGGLRGEAAASWARVWLERLGLQAQAQQHWSSMSTGFRMRAAIARALMVRLEVLILDEPIGPLDAATQRRVLMDLQGIAHDRDWPVAVIASSQHLAEVEAVADRVIILSNGRIVPGAAALDPSEASVFDISCTLSAVTLASLVPGSHAEDRGSFGVRVHLPAPMTAREWLQHALNAGADVQAFRDVSRSSLRFVDNDSPGAL
jgi:ABC-type multidrug transport system ATPase subunit